MHSRIFAALLTTACLFAQTRPRVSPNRNGNGAPTQSNSNLKPGTIDGTTINSITNTPVKKAVVSLRNSMQNFSYMAASDASGHFQFPEVEPGTYLVSSASAQGFSYLLPRRDKMLSSTITVAEGEHVTGITVQLRPFGVISGKIVGEDGDPIPAVSINALRYEYSRGPKMLVQVGAGNTDDRGEYRIFDLPPGRYFVRVAVRAPSPGLNTITNVRELGYPTTFYPGASELTQASRVEVKPGGETFGTDFRLQRVPVFHIRGKVEGVRPNNGQIQVRPCEGVQGAIPTFNSTSPQNDGNYDVAGLTPGAYCLTYFSFVPENGSSAREMVTISDQSVNGVTLSAVQGSELQGTAQMEGALSLTTPGQPAMRFDLQPMMGVGRYNSATVKDDGTFVFSGTSPGTYLINVNALPQGAYLKSLEYAERDISDGVLDITGVGGTLKVRLASDIGTLNGTVLTDKGDAANNVVVNIVPQGRLAQRRDLRESSVTDQNGKFQTKGLAPGDYRVMALDDNDTNIVLDDEFVAELGTKAASVTVHSGGNDSVELKVVSADDVDRIKSKL